MVVGVGRSMDENCRAGVETYQRSQRVRPESDQEIAATCSGRLRGGGGDATGSGGSRGTVMASKRGAGRERRR
jgi:hypothetical protein